MTHHLRVILVFALGGLTACQHRRAPASEPLATSAGDETQPAAGGYFVALSAKVSGSSDALALYDGVHDAVDAWNRRHLTAKGELGAYVEAFEADGYTRLAAGDDEIECDREKCLIKLTGRVLTGAAGEDSLAPLLTDALALKVAKPDVKGTGDTQIRTYVLGRREGSFIGCSQRGHGKAAFYRCEFALDRGIEAPASASVEAGGRGKLVSCVLSPGTVKTADEAKREVEGGELLSLTSSSGTGAKAVGYLRYVKQGASVEFLDLFLCGDVSHDYFHIEGTARDPKGWLAVPAKVGEVLQGLETLTQDEAKMRATARIVDESARMMTLEVRFKLAKDDGTADEVYGDDAFFVKLDKTWIQ